MSNNTFNFIVTSTAYNPTLGKVVYSGTLCHMIQYDKNGKKGAFFPAAVLEDDGIDYKLGDEVPVIETPYRDFAKRIVCRPVV